MREEWDTHKGKSRWRPGRGGGQEGLQRASQRMEDTSSEHSLADGWGDLGGQVDEQDQRGQRHKGMLGSGLFKSFSMALEEKEMKI